MTIPDETLNIDTPENVAFGYRVAGIGSRFLAALLDTLIITLLQVLVGLAVLLVFADSLRQAFRSDSGVSAWLLAIGGLILFAFYWGYYILFEVAWDGQSPGKRAAGLRVIRTDGAPITLTESAIRNLVRLIDLLPAYYGLGLVVMFLNDQSRRLGDLAAGTLVVYDQGRLTLDGLAKDVARRANALEQAPAVLAQPAPEAGWPLERLLEEDWNMAEDFMARREQFFNRHELAGQLARTLWERMLLPPPAPAGAEAERWIAQVLKAGRGNR